MLYVKTVVNLIKKSK